jgi:hypothetical protein
MKKGSCWEMKKRLRRFQDIETRAANLKRDGRSLVVRARIEMRFLSEKPEPENIEKLGRFENFVELITGILDGDLVRREKTGFIRTWFK